MTTDIGDAGPMTDDGLPHIFDEDAQLYDRARPRYPDALFTDPVELGTQAA